MITNDLKESAEGSAGLPVGIQIVGLPFQEERILGLMKLLSEWVKFEQNHQVPQI
jgi:Asp-tRNA(Asn)/Glu-tRNA(Gln) amidotransferase A subunit family amidase